jgi:RNA-directed DNA polymerase
VSSEINQRRYLFARDFYRLRRTWRPNAARREKRPTSIYRAATFEELSFGKIIDSENLLLVYEECKRECGKAPGLDGLTYDDLSKTEVAESLRVASEAIRERRYRPYPTRRVRIPKGDGQFRELRLPGVTDRTIAKAVAEAVTPAVDQILLPGVFGFRKGRGVWDMLLAIERAVVGQDRWVIVQDDIRSAFPSVRIADVLQDYHRHIQEPGVLYLLETVLRGHEGQRRTIGIDQGNAASPVTLNLRLHHALDLPLNATGPGNPPWYRYVDNLVVPCQSVSEGLQILGSAKQCLQPAGFRFKSEDGPPVNLRRPGAWVKILGFRVSLAEGRLRYELGQRNWQNLDRALERAHTAASPTHAARNAVCGWLTAAGPALV